MSSSEAIFRMSLRAACGAACMVGLLACGGGGSDNNRDLGASKTTLTVQVEDADGDSLRYEWRATAGSVENRNAPSTVWTLPDGPGLHFAYVTVHDGRGGYAQRQYAVSSDNLDGEAPVRTAVPYVAATGVDSSGFSTRLRIAASGTKSFAVPGGGPAAARVVYAPDVDVQVYDGATRVSAGTTDWLGELSLPKLAAGTTYQLTCARAGSAAAVGCGSVAVPAAGDPVATLRRLNLPDQAAHNLQLHGHVMLSDGGVCGIDDAFFGLQSTGTVQLLLADGTAATAPLRINRYGDYALGAAVPVVPVVPVVPAVGQGLQLRITCGAYTQTLPVPPSSDPAGYVAASPVELSHVIGNSRPLIVKMVANGADGNVRGQMVDLAEPAAESNVLPGALQFLAYKGLDDARSACAYYRALGAVRACDSQGRFTDPITLDDWRRAHKIGPDYAAAQAQVRADYVNRMDLNLVRRMEATRSAPNSIAFVVCNHPGPEGKTQREVDDVMTTAFDGNRLVACVAMEWSVSPGVNNGQPFTKFLTFGPDGSLLPSINLDGRGEKHMPGACVACHGGTAINGRFPDTTAASPYLGARFLPFATENYAFATSKNESAQHTAFHDLNRLVQATEPAADSATSRLVDAWYANGNKVLDKLYVPLAWQPAQTGVPESDALYRGVVGPACRTCHVAMGARFDWEANPGRLLNGVSRQHYCGGTAELALNASMPNALVSRDRIAERLQADPALRALVVTHLGCETPDADPVYGRR